MFTLILFALLGQPSKADLVKLSLIQDTVRSLSNLEDNEVHIDVTPIKQELLEEALLISQGQIQTLEQLEFFTAGRPIPNINQKGWFNFATVLWVLSAIIITLTSSLLFGTYFIDLIKLIPVEFWKGITLCLSVLLMCSGVLIEGSHKLSLVLLGCFGLIGSLGLCRIKIDKQAFILAMAWGIAAVYYQSQVIGFLTVAAAMVSLGFIAGGIPGMVYVGFTTGKDVVKCTVAAGIILTAYIIDKLNGTQDQVLDPFRNGMAFLGTFVYFLGILIISSKWFWVGRKQQQWDKYVISQFVAVGSCLIILYLGNVYNIPFLVGVSGPLICMYVIEKYYEIPWKEVGWLWSLFGLGVILYIASSYAQSHSDYFRLFAQ